MTDIEAGTKIRFKRDIEGEPTGDSPACTYAKKGDYGVITKVGGCWEGYWVKWDDWPHSFGCESKDFEVVDKENTHD